MILCAVRMEKRTCWWQQSLILRAVIPIFVENNNNRKYFVIEFEHPIRHLVGAIILMSDCFGYRWHKTEKRRFFISKIKADGYSLTFGEISPTCFVDYLVSLPKNINLSNEKYRWNDNHHHHYCYYKYGLHKLTKFICRK